MNEDKVIVVDGRKVAVSAVRHWRYSAESIAGTPADRWDVLERLKAGWDNLDADLILGLLSDRFSYGSYWVNSSLDRTGYGEYLPEKFRTIRNSDTAPKTDIVVLYEGLAANQYPYALRLIQGSNTALLTVNFDDAGVSSLYMTDPDIYTYEPTFRKGGVMSADGEPMCFRHECESRDAGREMTVGELQDFAVNTVAGLFRVSNAEIVSVHRSAYKEFPNIITRSGCDVLYHRIDVENHQREGVVCQEEASDYISTARKGNAIPLVMPVSFWCTDTDGGCAECGGSFFLKVQEARRIKA